MFGYRTGCLWPDVPDRFGPWKTLWKRHARFSKDGTWDRAVERLLVQADAANDNRQPVEPVDHAIGRSRGGLTTKPHTLVDGPGQARIRPDALLADKAHSSRAHHALPRCRGIKAVIPREGRPAAQPPTPGLARRPTGQLRHRAGQGPQRRRTLLRKLQAAARPGHRLRQARRRLPRCRDRAQQHRQVAPQPMSRPARVPVEESRRGHGRAGPGRSHAPDRAVRGVGVNTAPGVRRAPHRRGAERVLAVEPRARGRNPAGLPGAGRHLRGVQPTGQGLPGRGGAIPVRRARGQPAGSAPTRAAGQPGAQPAGVRGAGADRDRSGLHRRAARPRLARRAGCRADPEQRAAGPPGREP